MRKAVLLLLLLAVVLTTPGCFMGFTMNAEHNKGHWEIIKKDIREWHSDVDFILGLDEPTLLESHYR